MLIFMVQASVLWIKPLVYREAVCTDSKCNLHTSTMYTKRPYMNLRYSARVRLCMCSLIGRSECHFSHRRTSEFGPKIANMRLQRLLRVSPCAYQDVRRQPFKNKLYSNHTRKAMIQALLLFDSFSSYTWDAYIVRALSEGEYIAYGEWRFWVFSGLPVVRSGR